MNNQTDCPCKPIVVLDTSAFVAGYDPFSSATEQVTTPKVEAEIRRNSMVKMRLETAIESGKLKVQAPSQMFLNRIRTPANKVGDSFKLSETDTELLALALELKEQGFAPRIVTDDYSIQNVARQIGIEFVALATYGIKKLLEWVRYCPACHKEYSADSKSKECLICGTELKRKPRRQR